MGAGLEKGSTVLVADALAQETHFSRKEITKLHEQFQRLAHQRAANSYTIGPQQFAEVMALCGLDQRQSELVHDLFKVFDRDNSGTIDFREFMAGLSTLMRGTPEERAEFAFDLYDVDKSGTITREELRHAMLSIYGAQPSVASRTDGDSADGAAVDGVAEARRPSAPHLVTLINSFVDEVFQEADANHDNVLSRSEFSSAVKNHPSLLAFMPQAETQ